MNKHWLAIAGFGILFLFFIQMVGMLIESIYILDLLKTSLDEKVLGVLFLFAPLLLLIWGKRTPRWLIWLVFVLLVLGRSAAPYLNTSGRMLASGLASGAALLLIPIMLVETRGLRSSSGKLIPAQGLALAIGLSVLLRTLNYSLDLSLTAAWGWTGWLLAVLLGVCLWGMLSGEQEEFTPTKKGVTSPALGVCAVLTLVYFVYASPAVIARWTQASYIGIVLAVAVLTLGWLVISAVKPEWISRIGTWPLLVWNLLFCVALTATVLAHTIAFPATPESAVVVVASPTWVQQIPLVVMLLLFPVIFIDFAIFSGVIAQEQPSPRRLALGFWLGMLILLVLVFMSIFTNVWGYVEPVSLWMRNKFWLPLLLVSALITLLAAWVKRRIDLAAEKQAGRLAWVVAAVILGALLVHFGWQVWQTSQIAAPAADPQTLTVMTYNMQQANDKQAEKSYLRQLELIRKINPDILGLQESDSTRIGLGNNDYVRYYAEKLGYHSYYGPKTVTGTYGTALLSKYPINNALSFFSYSDADEIGTVQAEVVVGDKLFTVFNVHPAGSDAAMMAFAQAFLERAKDQPNMIAMGDYNLREGEAAYEAIAAVYREAWKTAYPNGIDARGLDLSGEKMIDHIFIGPELTVEDAFYLLAPESATDHPAHWAIIGW